MAAIGNLSEQAGFALKKIGLLFGSPFSFLGKPIKSFPFKNKVSASELISILFHSYKF